MTPDEELSRAMKKGHTTCRAAFCKFSNLNSQKRVTRLARKPANAFGDG